MRVQQARGEFAEAVQHIEAQRSSSSQTLFYQVVAREPIRQWACSLPWRLRYAMATTAICVATCYAHVHRRCDVRFVAERSASWARARSRTRRSELGRARQGREYLERALSISEKGVVAPLLLAEVRFELTKNLWALRVRDRARELANAALEACQADKHACAAAIEDWKRE